MIRPITPKDPESKSADALAENIDHLKRMFPEAVTEGKVDFDVLKQLLSGVVDEREEKYGLNWHGKRKARQLALTPSMGTLRPCKEESVDWESTKNLFIEGDNLEVLKLLRKSYAGKVKMIYIDPPYNTGKDFIYPDDFRDGIRNYLELTGQVDGEGRKLETNSEASGRYHTDWLNMMYPRLKVARELLREDGVIFISIDDGEIKQLRCLCDELFGEENFVVPIIWQKRVTPENRRAFSFEHDYIVCYARSAEIFTHTRRLLPLTEEARSRYRNPDNDPRGDWLSVPAIAQAGHGTKSQFYELTAPDGRVLNPPSGCCWRYTEERMKDAIADNRIWFGFDGGNAPRIKNFLSESKQGLTPSTIWPAKIVGANEDAKKEVKKIFDENVLFDNPKPTGLIEQMQSIASEEHNSDIILDFFAGSGTTGHSVMKKNFADGGNRKYILVQLPEKIEIDNKEQNEAARYCEIIGKSNTIAELTKERIRRAAQKIRSENPETTADLGFRVFKLDSSNIKAWHPDASDLEATIDAHIEHLVPGRTAEDILYEVLLKLGLELSVPIESRTIAGHTVNAIGGGTLITCLSESIPRKDIEALGQGIIDWVNELDPEPREETTLVFRDDAFKGDDVSKTNLSSILEQDGLRNLRSI